MSVIDLLTQTIGGDAVDQISGKLGADRDATASAVAGALPMILGALARNASSPEGAESLSRALSEDHDGSVLDNLGNAISGADAGPGAGILRHALGGRQRTVEAGLAGASGLDAGSVSKVLQMLAPIVMGALAKEKSQQGLDAAGVANLLERERGRAESAAPSLAWSLLDGDGDGDIKDDLAEKGAAFVGKFLGGR